MSETGAYVAMATILSRLVRSRAHRQLTVWVTAESPIPGIKRVWQKSGYARWRTDSMATCA